MEGGREKRSGCVKKMPFLGTEGRRGGGAEAGRRREGGREREGRRRGGTEGGREKGERTRTCVRACVVRLCAYPQRGTAVNQVPASQAIAGHPTCASGPLHKITINIYVQWIVCVGVGV